MSGHVGHQLRLSASRIRPRIPRPPHGGKCLPHESHHQHLTPRTTYLQGPGQRRHFGVADVAGTLLRGSDFLITNIHDVTGAPWFVSIPLLALTVGAAIRMPLTLYSHEMARRRARLLPLIQAQTAMLGRGLRKKSLPDLREKVVVAMKTQTRGLFRAFGVSETRSIIGGIMSLPIFLSNLEVIRRMCGGPRGLLGNLVFGATAAGGEAAAAAEPAEAASAPSASAVDVTPAADLVVGDLAASGTQDALASIALEPSFATGGCLWFPNLLEADPYHALPFAVSAVLILNLFPESSEARRELFGLQPVAGSKHAALQGQSRGRRGLQRTMLLVALAIGPVTMDMPAALHLYWLASASFNLALSKGIKIIRPLPKNTVKPCRGMEVALLRPKPT